MYFNASISYLDKFTDWDKFAWDVLPLKKRDFKELNVEPA